MKNQSFIVKDLKGQRIFDLTLRPCNGKFTKGSGNTDFNNANSISPVPSGVWNLDRLIVYFDSDAAELRGALGAPGGSALPVISGPAPGGQLKGRAGEGRRRAGRALTTRREGPS